MKRPVFPVTYYTSYYNVRLGLSSGGKNINLRNRGIRRKNQEYALIVPLLYFYVLVPTCFGSSLPSSGSLLDPSELLENTN
jgi:hypothetical protein